MKSVHFIQILSIALAIVAYYAGIMLNIFVYYAQNYADIIASSLAYLIAYINFLYLHRLYLHTFGHLEVYKF